MTVCASKIPRAEAETIARRARTVGCTSANRPIAVDWLQLKLK
jgi:hypothetical protein